LHTAVGQLRPPPIAVYPLQTVEQLLVQQQLAQQLVVKGQITFYYPVVFLRDLQMQYLPFMKRLNL
jgi:hypothetical protein